MLSLRCLRRWSQATSCCRSRRRQTIAQRRLSRLRFSRNPLATRATMVPQLKSRKERVATGSSVRESVRRTSSQASGRMPSTWRRPSPSCTKIAANTSSLTRVWRGAAMRQHEARQQAEVTNIQLKRMVEATLRHSQRLQALLEFPQGVESLTYKKIVRKYEGDNRLRDSITFHNLLIAQELLFFDVPSILKRFAGVDCTESAAIPSQPSELGCGVHIEAMDSRALPYSILKVSESAWKFFTTDAKSNASSTSIEMNGDSVARNFTLDVVHNVLCTTYMARCVYRRRIDNRGRVIIAWTCALVPHGPWNQEPYAATHETSERAGFVVLSPLHSDPARATMAQSYYRVKREACAEMVCTSGGCDMPTARTLARSMRLCSKTEIKRWLEGIEGELTLQGSTQGALLLRHAQGHESSLLPCSA